MLLVMIDERVSEIHRAALAIGEAAIVEHLEQHIEDVVVRLLDFIEQAPRSKAGGAPLR